MIAPVKNHIFLI